MIAPFFHRWELRLAEVSRADRVVRPFEWGLDWLVRPQVTTVAHLAEDAGGSEPPAVPSGERAAADPRAAIRAWVDQVMRDSDAFFTPAPTRDYVLIEAPEQLRAGGEAGTLTFPSGFTTPHPTNNTVYARYFPANPVRRPKAGAPRRAVVVLAQWNSDPEGHIGLCKLLAKLGIASLRITTAACPRS